jgi:hypothetical protein
MQTDFTKFENQFQKHDVRKGQQYRKGRMAVNEFGRPEAMFVYGQAQDAAPTEFTVDIDMAEVRTDSVDNGRAGMYQPAHYGVDIVGAQFLCPRCHSALYVKGKGMPNGKEIVVHWDNVVQSQNDGLFRPTISVDGVLKCDYFDYEIVGSGSGGGGMSKGLSMRCGWQGGVINGRMFDHKEGLIL